MGSASFMKVDEVAQELGVSKSYAYKIVQKLNAELAEKGYVVISGRVNKQYFYGTHLLRCRQEREVNLWQYIKNKKTNTWRVLYRYTDWNGERKQTQKARF